jgi:hypothetical protein
MFEGKYALLSPFIPEPSIQLVMFFRLRNPFPIISEGRSKLRLEDNTKTVLDAIECRNVAGLMWSSAP